MNTTLKNGVLLFAVFALVTFSFALAAISGKLVGTLREADATAHTTRETMGVATRIVDERTKAVVDKTDPHLRVARQEIQATSKDLRAVVDQADGRLASIQADVKAIADRVVTVAQSQLCRANDSIGKVSKIRAERQSGYGVPKCHVLPGATEVGETPNYTFGLLLVRMSSRISPETCGRPGFPQRTFQVENSRKPLRCHAMTVSGLAIANAWLRSTHRADASTAGNPAAVRID